MKFLLTIAVFVLGQEVIAAPEVQTSPNSKTMDVCKVELEKFCKGIHGPSNRLSCLKSNEAKLSTECKAALTAR